MGTVEVQLRSAIVQYPSCIWQGDRIQALGTQKSWSQTALLGVGAFLTLEECQNYGFPTNDEEDTPVAATEMDLGLGVQLQWQGEERVQDLFIPKPKPAFLNLSKAILLISVSDIFSMQKLLPFILSP
jgi:hypothetical protein